MRQLGNGAVRQWSSKAPATERSYIFVAAIFLTIASMAA